ncbi:MAG: divalent metal cation transporter [Pirellulales bacterium]|nr:divalent metal cation transporter [Pirellulales bacterium]
MSDQPSKVESDRQMLAEAQAKGGGAVWATYVKLSGPGWLQSAITLGGGSLAGALFLGILGGTSMLWLQLMAIIMGVVMLSAISYVTLSTGERPFNAINTHINPALGWGWLVATGMANMIWCMPQFSLCFAALNKNLASETVSDSLTSKLTVSAVILVAVSIVVMLNSKRGVAARIFDWFLKALVGMIVICFFGVTIYLSRSGSLDWGTILSGFIPDFSQWTQPTGKVEELIQGLSQADSDFWSPRVVKAQRAIMIGAAATAVGINMTFLMPYAMLQRGWDKTFRGLARFDLSTGMAIPYVLVTTCVVIAASQAFHATPPDSQFMSTDAATFYSSKTFGGASGMLLERVEPEAKDMKFKGKFDELSDAEKAAVAEMASLPEAEKLIASSMVKRDAFTLSNSLAPLLGKDVANYVFGIGVFGMGFSTIIILMLINGFVFCEAAGKPQGGSPFVAGCLIAGVTGAIWPLVWDGPAKLWLAILASSFGMMLLPIAYITFFMMMNSKTLMGDEKPKGASMVTWNILMGISVIGALCAAATAIYDKASHPTAGPVVIVVGVVYVVLVILGFVYMAKKKTA